MRTVAEWVLPGHPDKLADRIADALVDAALVLDPRALVGVEVAVHRSFVLVDGRIGCPNAETINVAEIVQKIYAEQGYSPAVIPDPASLKIVTDLCQNDFTPGEREHRSLADDQNIVTGYAEDRPETNFLPLAPTVARAIGCELARICETEPEFGPDGKVIVMLEEPPDALPRLATVSFSLHHRDGVSLVDIRRTIKECLGKAATKFPELQTAWPGGMTEIRSNGAGDFAVGGPEGDNGLSGKKLVVDAYGPGIPIGGGALSGKDPHKVDRVFAFRARQIAKQLVLAGLAECVLVQLATIPGERQPSWTQILFGRRDGDVRIWEPAPARLVDRWLAVYDLTIDGSVRDLGLTQICYAPLAISGHFTDPDLPWERWQPGRIST